MHPLLERTTAISTAAPRQPLIVGRLLRWLRLLVGIPLLLAGLAVIAAGVVAHAAPAGSYVGTPTIGVATYTAAITATPDTVEDTGWLRRLGPSRQTRVTATGLNGPIFVGVARSRDVDAWLAGTARYDLVQLGGTTTYHRLPGAVRALPGIPTDRSFWLAQASGTGTLHLAWSTTGEPLTVVLANSDGSADVTANVEAETSVPTLSGFTIPLLLAGGVLALAGLALLSGWARSRRTTRTRHGGGPPSPATTAQTPVVPRPREPIEEPQPNAPG